MSNLSFDDAMNIIRSRELISEPGKYRVKVSSVTPYVRENGQAVQITNFSAMTPYQIGQAKKFFAEGNVQAGLNQQLKASPRIGQDYCPQKGDFVDIHVNYVTTKDGASALLVQSVSAVPLNQTKKVSLTAFGFGETESEVFDNQPSTVEEA